MKYKIVKTDLQIDNKLYSEGSEVELTKEQTKGIEAYLIPLDEAGHPELVEGSQKKTKIKGNKK